MTTATVTAPRGFTTVRVYYDGHASRKGDRVWKVMLPLSESMVGAEPLAHPMGSAVEGSLAHHFEAVLPAATALVEARLGFTPEWVEGVHPTTGFRFATVALPQEDDA